MTGMDFMESVSRPRVAAIVICLMLTGCGEQDRLVERNIRFMGEHVVVSVPADNEAALEWAGQAIRQFSGRLYPLIDIYSPESEISRANQIAYRVRFPISRETQRLLESAQRLSTDLEGLFDVSDATLRHLWHRHFQENPEELLAAPLVHVSRRGIGPHFYDIQEHSLLYLASETQLDLNDFARPYVIDQAVRQLRNLAVTGVKFHAGRFGRVLGSRSEIRSWSHLITHPGDGKRILGEIMLPDGAAFTLFGWPDDFAQVGDQQVARIIHPRTGWPAEGKEAVFVMGPTAANTYALANAVFVQGREESESLLVQHRDHQVMFVQRSDPTTIWITPNLAPLFVPADDYKDRIQLIMLPEPQPPEEAEEEEEEETVNEESDESDGEVSEEWSVGDWMTLEHIVHRLTAATQNGTCSVEKREYAISNGLPNLWRPYYPAACSCNSGRVTYCKAASLVAFRMTGAA